MDNKMEVAGRLPKTALPRLYTLTLRIAPEQGAFEGRIVIDVEIQKPIKALTLHALALDIRQAQIHQKGTTFSAQALEKADETISLSFPKSLAPGWAQVEIIYSGILNQQLRGLYQADHNGERFVFTQFEATDARRMFPCFDEPDMKARFSLTVTYPAHLTALSNMPVIEERHEADGQKTTRFDETPVMSTYLLALAIAPFQCKTIPIAGTRVSVWALPEQIALSEFALNVTAAVLPRLNAYFDLPYPYPKLDLIAAPNFAMGAMENWGAIFFRDSCLLLSESFASTTTKRDVANVITHEIVHQWFGNLVTMHWWDDLWLNESFATWLACKIVDQWRPEWNSWTEFQQEKETPLFIDALENTRPIRSDVSSSAQIEELFDALTYEKGAACLRMIETFLGEAVFREGIRNYIKAFQYQNASADDLWKALAAASGRPVGDIARDWFTQPGFPLVTLRHNPNLPATVIFEQRRFTAKSQDMARGRWAVPFTFRYQDSRGVHHDRILLSDAETPLTLPEPAAFIYGNADESGFLRVDYDPSLRAKLEAVLPNALNPSERIGYLGHLWAFTFAGRFPLDSFLDTVCRFKGDTTRVVVQTLTQYLEGLHDTLVDPHEMPLFRSWVRDFLAPVWHAVGWDPSPGEDDERRLTRAAALWGLGALGEDEDILAELPRRKIRYETQPASLDPTLATPLLRLCARFDGGSLFDPFVKKYQAATTPEERDRYLRVLADFNKPALARSLLSMTLTPMIRSQDVWKPIRFLLGNKSAREVCWDYLKAHWGALHEKGGSVGATRMIGATHLLWKPEWKTDVEQFFNIPSNKVDAAERTLAQTLEHIEMGITFCAHQRGRLSTWLHARPT